jgi:hypothetical protein
MNLHALSPKPSRHRLGSALRGNHGQEHLVPVPFASSLRHRRSWHAPSRNRQIRREIDGATTSAWRKIPAFVSATTTIGATSSNERRHHGC